MQSNSTLPVVTLDVDGASEAHADGGFFHSEHPLSAGQYWRSIDAIDGMNIDRDEVLLVESLKWVENSIHTVVLRAHPLKISAGPKEHRFLVREFMGFFKPEVDGDSIRLSEMRDVQIQVGELQKELMDTQTNPHLMQAMVAHEMSKDHQPVAGLLGSSDSKTVDTSSVGAMIASGVTPATVASLRAAAGQELKIAKIKAQWIQNKTQEISKTLQKMTPFIEEQAACALAHTEDVRSNVENILKGIESLDIFLCKDVTVVQLRSGESAPDSEPLTVFQQKLFMDEELCLHEDIDHEFSTLDHQRFTDLIASNFQFVEQITRVPRSVVVMATNRKSIAGGNDVQVNAQNQANKECFLIVRNGENVYMIHSPVESHLGANRLFPTRNEAEGHFRGIDGSTINFEDVAFTSGLSKHDSMALHYKRFLLLIWGLDHRDGLFGKFYPQGREMDFLKMDFQSSFMRFISDDDASTMLPGMSQRPGVMQWMAEQNSYLQSGSRVICFWNLLMTPDTAPAACQVDRHSRRGFRKSYFTANAIDECIVYKNCSELAVQVAVKGHTKDNVERKFECVVTLTKFTPAAYNPDPAYGHLCLDMCTVEDIDWYLNHRDSWVHHASFIRLFKRARRILVQTQEQEALPRQKMLQALNEGRLIDNPEDGHELIQMAVRAWRAANRGKPIPSGPAEDEVQWAQLLDQMYALAKSYFSTTKLAKDYFAAKGLNLLRLSIDGKSQTVAYFEAEKELTDDRLQPFAWVHRSVMTVKKNGMSEKQSKWVRMLSTVPSENVVFENQDAKKWIGRPAAFASPEEKTTVLDQATHWKDSLKSLCKKVTRDELDELVETYFQKKSKTELRPGSWGLSIGAIIAVQRGHNEHRMIVAAVENIPGLLLEKAQDEDREYLKSKISSWTRINWARTEMEGPKFTLCAVKDLNLAEKGMDFVALQTASFGRSKFNQLSHFSHNLTLDQWFGEYANSHPKTIFVHEDFFDPEGNSAIVKTIGYEASKDFDPVKVFVVEVDIGNEETGKKSVSFLEIAKLDHPACSKSDILSKHNMKTFQSSSHSHNQEVYPTRELALACIAEDFKYRKIGGFYDPAGLGYPDPLPGIERLYFKKQ